MRQGRSSNVKRMTGVGGCIASALAASVVFIAHPRIRPTDFPVGPKPLVVPVALSIPVLPIVRLESPRVHHARDVRTVKQGVFPTPTRLSAEESALIAMTESFPAETNEAFSRLLKAAEAPDPIEPLTIAPLTGQSLPGER